MMKTKGELSPLSKQKENCHPPVWGTTAHQCQPPLSGPSCKGPPFVLQRWPRPGSRGSFGLPVAPADKKIKIIKQKYSL